jgi:hypothetical protein
MLKVCHPFRLAEASSRPTLLPELFHAARVMGPTLIALSFAAFETSLTPRERRTEALISTSTAFAIYDDT